MAIYPLLPSPADSSDLPESRRAALCFLFGLASNEVYMCPVCYQPGGSLLHCLSTLTGRTGGLFLLHCLWSRLRQTLSGILPCEARTFLSHGLSVPWQRPSVLLANATYSIILFLKCLYPIITSTTIGKDNIKCERKRKPPDALFFYLKSTEREVRTCETTDI